MTHAVCESLNAHDQNEPQEQAWRAAAQLVEQGDDGRQPRAAEKLSAFDEEHSGDTCVDAGERTAFARADANAALRRVIGERIAAARRLNGWDQCVFASELGFANSSQPSLWEAGKRLPPLAMLIEAARVLGVSVDYLLGESEEADRDPKSAAKAALFRRVRRLLARNTQAVAECLLEAVSSPAEDELRLSRFATRANALCASVEAFSKLNASVFDDARGGATLLRTCDEMRESLKHVDRFLARAEHSRSMALQRARRTTQPLRQMAGATV